MADRIGGFLSLEALRSGMREQYAVRRSAGTVVIELTFENNCFVVSTCVTKPGVASSSTSTSHHLLNAAHVEFARLVRKYP